MQMRNREISFSAMPFLYKGLQGPEKRDELQPIYAHSMRI
jgi:hypothetical protein